MPAVAANQHSPGGRGDDGAKRKAKETLANCVLVKCFGVSSVKDKYRVDERVACCSCSLLLLLV